MSANQPHEAPRIDRRGVVGLALLDPPYEYRSLQATTGKHAHEDTLRKAS